MEKILQTVPNTTPGIGNINYLMLINSPLLMKKLLLSIYNDLWLKGDMIPEFKKIVLLPILKLNKPQDSINSYRPISLLPCITKMYEIYGTPWPPSYI